MTRDPLTLLGKPIDDRAVTSFVATFAGELVSKPTDPDLPDRRYVVGEDAELELLADAENRLQTIFLYLNGYKGHRQYGGPLPCGLHAGMTQQEVRSVLGAPQFERPAGEVEYLGRFGPMERYDHDGYSIHLQYSEVHGCIEQVTLAVAGSVPRRKDLH